MTDIDFIAPQELEFIDGDLRAAIRPANVACLAKLLRSAGPLVDELMFLPPELIGRFEAGAPNTGDLREVFDLVCLRGDLALELVAIASGIERTKIDALLPDRFAYLFALVVSVNADFFSRAAPGIQAAGQRLATVWGSSARPGPAASTA